MNDIAVPYVMQDVQSVGRNGFSVVSTFAGCGGSSLGYRIAGFSVLAAVEFIPIAAETYEANADARTRVMCRDVRTISGAEILGDIGLKIGALDVLDGSPPCASFSTAGLGAKKWGAVRKYSETKQRTDDLFAEYIRLVDELRPKIFIAENVRGLVSGTGIGTFFDIHDMLTDIGYRVEARLLDSQWLGVPQMRQRVIIMGVRNDLVSRTGEPLRPLFPLPRKRRTIVADACPWMCDEHGNEHGPVPVNEIDENELGPSIDRYAIGQRWHTLRLGERPEKSCYNMVRLDPSRPAQTITATDGCVSAAGTTHPYVCRRLSVPELRRICSFPDDFILLGTYQQRVERIGRSVPPLMMGAVARCVADILGRAY